MPHWQASTAASVPRYRYGRHGSPPASLRLIWSLIRGYNCTRGRAVRRRRADLFLEVLLANVPRGRLPRPRESTGRGRMHLLLAASRSARAALSLPPRVGRGRLRHGAAFCGAAAVVTSTGAAAVYCSCSAYVSQTTPHVCFECHCHCQRIKCFAPVTLSQQFALKSIRKRCRSVWFELLTVRLGPLRPRGCLAVT